MVKRIHSKLEMNELKRLLLLVGEWVVKNNRDDARIPSDVHFENN